MPYETEKMEVWMDELTCVTMNKEGLCIIVIPERRFHYVLKFLKVLENLCQQLSSLTCFFVYLSTLLHDLVMCSERLYEFTNMGELPRQVELTLYIAFQKTNR